MSATDQSLKAQVLPPTKGEDRAPKPNFGKVIEGTVTAVSPNEVELRLDDGRSAVITRNEFGLHNEAPSDVLSINDKAFGIELARQDPKQRVVLSRTWVLKQRMWEQLIKSYEQKNTIKGKVIDIKSKGLVLDVGLPGYLPASHLELDDVADLTTYKGKTLEVKILDCDAKKEKLVLSRRSLLHKEKRVQVAEAFAALEKGQRVTGTVSSLSDYGVFVDLGEATGLIHMTELSWGHSDTASDVAAVGDELEVIVLDVQPKKKRIALSLKRLSPNPLAAIEEGSIHVALVSRLLDYGAIVRLNDGTEGLVHVSEFSEYHINHPSEMVMPGDEVSVKVLTVDLEKNRVKFSIKQAIEFTG